MKTKIFIVYQSYNEGWDSNVDKLNILLDQGWNIKSIERMSSGSYGVGQATGTSNWAKFYTQIVFASLVILEKEDEN